MTAGAHIRDEVSLVLVGAAGQGIQTVEYLLTRMLKRSGYHVFATREFMSRIRGGMNSTEIRVGSQPVAAFVDRIDVVIPLAKGALTHLGRRVTDRTVIVGEAEFFDDAPNEASTLDVPLTDIASEIGGKIYANTIAVGLLCGIFLVELGSLEQFIREYFAEKKRDIIENNVEAIRRGYERGEDFRRSKRLVADVGRNSLADEELLVSGAEAVALGAMAGGCNFCSFYPMSPGTSVAVFLAQHGKEFGVLVEQAEDEIAAINMILGAWYAGGRGLVTTSGGGFALMVEGLSLAGILESPAVIHVGQRPGPATGLPTRTEQGDLEFVIRAGHGEFPRLILAPGSLEEAFFLTQRAFNLADKYQLPVIVLTDQYLLDSSWNVPVFNLYGVEVEQHVVPTQKEYQRYVLSQNGLSPRGVPGHGQGVVVLDSDEHDTAGHITEDFSVRTEMVDKRLRKGNLLKEAEIPPTRVGPEEPRTVVVGWGSSLEVLREALARLDRPDVAVLHYSQVYPLPQVGRDYLERARQRVVVEQNATGQFARVLQQETGIRMEHHLGQYNGLPFSVEALTARLQGLLEEA